MADITLLLQQTQILYGILDQMTKMSQLFQSDFKVQVSPGITVPMNIDQIRLMGTQYQVLKNQLAVEIAKLPVFTTFHQI